MRSEHDVAKSANKQGKKREQPILITEAPPSPKAELDYRRRRYAITMGIRVVCLILAAAFHNIIWLWPVFAVGAIALPWIAVVLANDRLPAKSSRFQRYAGVPNRQLGQRDDSHRVIDE